MSLSSIGSHCSSLSPAAGERIRSHQSFTRVMLRIPDFGETSLTFGVLPAVLFFGEIVRLN